MNVYQMTFVCSLIPSMTTSSSDHFPTTIWKAANTTAKVRLWNRRPFLNKCVCKLLQSVWWVLTIRNSSLKNVPSMLDWIKIRRLRRPIHSFDCLLFKILVDESGAMRPSIIVHKDEIVAYRTCKRTVEQSVQEFHPGILRPLKNHSLSRRGPCSRHN